MEFVLNVHSGSTSTLIRSALKSQANVGISTPNQRNVSNVILDTPSIQIMNVNKKQRKQPTHFVLNGLMEFVLSVLKDPT